MLTSSDFHDSKHLIVASVGGSQHGDPLSAYAQQDNWQLYQYVRRKTRKHVVASRSHRGIHRRNDHHRFGIADGAGRGLDTGQLAATRSAVAVQRRRVLRDQVLLED